MSYEACNNVRQFILEADESLLPDDEIVNTAEGVVNPLTLHDLRNIVQYLPRFE